MTVMPDSDQGYGTGETSIISKQNLPDLNVDADLHGTAATMPDDVEQDPLAGTAPSNAARTRARASSQCGDRHAGAAPGCVDLLLETRSPSRHRMELLA
jgi:hypothetical protein